MARHILRKDLKRDAIRDGVMRGAESVASHQKILWAVVGAALVIAVAVFGWNSYSRRQTVRAAAALQDAMETYQARIRVVGEMPESGETTYLDDKNKYTDAERKFLDVTQRFGRTRPGQLARYYAALCEVRLKQFDAAENNLKQLESVGDEGLAGLAKFQLAGVYVETGKGAQAAELYKQLADQPTLFVPKALALLSLADYYRRNDPEQASKIYNQVKQDFPDSPAAEQADKGLELLNAKT